MSRNGDCMKKTICLAGIPLLVLIDQLTKYWARTWLSVKGPVVLIPGALELRYLTNQGSAWGMLSGQMVFFYIFTILALGILGFVWYRIPAEKKYRKLLLIMTFMIAGALGNLIDRVIFRYVIDFIYISLIDFPIFNVADMYVTIPAAFLVLFVLTVYKDDEFTFLRRKKEPQEKGEQ
ncbi:MAG: signal peptidase II [Lachnospiraceae bacterium]|nr:signal peptidase II [Lachnospiraceae bacterium]